MTLISMSDLLPIFCRDVKAFHSLILQGQLLLLSGHEYIFELFLLLNDLTIPELCEDHAQQSKRKLHRCAGDHEN